MAVPALANGNESIIDRLKAEGQLTRNSGTNSLKVVISKLQGIFDLLSAQLSLQQQKDVTQRFQKDETESESARLKRMKEFGGKVVEQTKKGIEAIGGFVSKLLRALAAPALLAFLAFLPEILESKLFKEALEFAQNTLVPLLNSFKDNVLIPIANFFKNGFTKLLEDLNDPEMDFSDVVSENLPIIGASLAILFRKQIIGIFTKSLPLIFTSLGPLLAKAFAVGSAGLAAVAASLNPVVLGALAVGAVIALLSGIFQMLPEQTKDAIKQKIYAVNDAIGRFFESVIEGFKSFLLMLVPDMFGLKEKAAGILGVDVAEEEAKIDERKVRNVERAIKRIEGSIEFQRSMKVDEEALQGLKNTLEQKRLELEELKGRGGSSVNTNVVDASSTDASTTVVSNTIQGIGPIEVTSRKREALALN